MAIRHFTVTAPSHWASYYINDDASGLTDDEIKAADKFAVWLARNEPNLACIDIGDEEFIHYHDAFDFYPYAADCSPFKFIVVETDVVLQEVTQ
jgi:hypothetical protein